MVAEQHSFKSCGIAIAEVLSSSCGIAIADSKKVAHAHFCEIGAETGILVPEWFLKEGPYEDFELML